jgi:hypothetical protein
MRKRFVLIVALLALGIGGVSGFLFRARASERADEKYRQFCYATWDGIREDRRAFESGEPKRVEEAFDRFYVGRHIYHGSESILLCIDELPTLDVFCRLELDLACHLRLAKEIEQQLYEVTHR